MTAAFAVLFIGLAETSRTWAVTPTWSGTSSTNRSNALNWGGVAPGTADVVLFDLGAYSNQPSVDTAASSVGGIWDTGSGSVSISVSGGTLTLNVATVRSNAKTLSPLSAGRCLR